MGKILGFFTRGGKDKSSTRSFEVLLDRVRPFAQPALRLRKKAAASRSYLGGCPPLPENISWPEKDGRQLAFLAAIDLAAVASTGVVPWLPKAGQLLFFYDVDGQPWGFDPKDRGSWEVIHVFGDVEERLGIVDPLPKCFVDFEVFESLPDWERFESLGISMSDEEVDTFMDHVFEDDDEELHQISGFPRNVQGDGMELECQLASIGVYVGDSSGYESHKAEALQSGAKDWRLLFQHSGDDDAGLM